MKVKDLILYLNDYSKKENQVEDYHVEVDGDTNIGIVIKNNTGDKIDSFNLQEQQL